MNAVAASSRGTAFVTALPLSRAQAVRPLLLGPCSPAERWESRPLRERQSLAAVSNGRHSQRLCAACFAAATALGAQTLTQRRRRRPGADVVPRRGVQLLAIDPSVAEVSSSSLALAFASPERPLEVLVTLAGAILCHEAGHFLCARSVGLPAAEFALGFGPEVVNFGRDQGGTEFVLRAFPFGGYVRFNDEKTIKLEDGQMVNEFEALAAPAKLLVLSGGVLANIVTAWSSLCAAALTVGVPKQEPLPGIRVEDVGQEAVVRTGLRANDVLLRIGSLDLGAPGQEVGTTVDFIHTLPARTPVELLVDRAGQQIRLDALTITDVDSGLQRLGVMINSNSQKVIVKADGFPEASAVALDAVLRLAGEQVKALQGVFTGSSAGEVVGPIGMIRQGEDLADAQGLLGLGMFFVSVNLNLAVLNALPIPALDGGKAAFVLIEQVLGRRLDEGKKQDVELAFVLLVIFGLVSLTAKDISKMFGK